MARTKLVLRLGLGALGVWAGAMIAGPAPAAPHESLQNTPIAVTALSADIVHELNAARMDPLSEIPKLPGLYPPAQTNDGATFLRGHAAMPALIWSSRLAAAAQVQVTDQMNADPPGHIGADGSNPMVRITRQGWHSMTTAEEISVGQISAVGAIRQLIIDPPGPNHPHRYDLFSDPTLKYIGVACGPNTHVGMICVIDLAGSPLDPSELDHAAGPAHVAPVANTTNVFTLAELATNSCWIDAKTGLRVPTGPVGWSPTGLANPNPYVTNSDANHMSNSKTGQNYVNDPDKGWIDAKTGERVPTGPVGWSPTGLANPNPYVTNSDANHMSNSKTGQNYVRVPCPGA